MSRIVSFCIATYNRKSKVVELVQDILCNVSPEFEVIVSDDCSEDGTVEALELIKDDRLHIFRNFSRQGPNKNWYIALSKGTGKYLLQVLDRDWINKKAINEFLDILRHVEVGFGYAGISIMTDDLRARKERYCIFYKEEEAALRFACVPVHPTGVIFSKTIWDKCKNKEMYFNKELWGVYPHSYLYAIFAQISDGIRINIDICDKRRSEYKKMSQSRYYSAYKGKQSYWWTPEACFKELLLEIKLIEKLRLSQDLREQLIIARYRNQLMRVAIEYRYTAGDKKHMEHYGMKPYQINMVQQICIGVGFYQAFKKVFGKRGYYKNISWRVVNKTRQVIWRILCSMCD